MTQDNIEAKLAEVLDRLRLAEDRILRLEEELYGHVLSVSESGLVWRIEELERDR
jgi:hypothetical protein